MVSAPRISRPYGPGLIEAIDLAPVPGVPGAGFPGPMGRASLKPAAPGRAPSGGERISRPYGPGLIEALIRSPARAVQVSDFPALWAGPH